MKRWLLAFLWLIAAPLFGHELRPAYLEVREEKVAEFLVLWKTPMRGGMRLALSPEFSGRNEKLTPVFSRPTDNASVQTWRMKSLDPLRGQRLRIAGLDGTMTDALVRIEFADGAAWTQRLTPGRPAARIPELASGLEVMDVYLRLGVEHILLGVDHLLFVLSLLLIVRGRWMLVKTVTAFTVAHSITLALAALGFVHAPSPPVEAAIALSIVLVAVEVVRSRRGIRGITARAPWAVAFAFGLLHGFGFAGALAELGLPEGRIPLALLFFNLGVEAGQLIFVAAALGVFVSVRRMSAQLPRWTELAPPYAVGIIAMFWVIQRIAVF
ncbi:MAG: HupE/UreJ family protein [Gammaproteobacteria bacterium]